MHSFTRLGQSTSSRRRTSFIIPLVFLGWIVTGLSTTGCVRNIANLIHVIQGPDIDPEFGQFKGKRVAVVVTTPSGRNADASAMVLSRTMNSLMAQKIKKVTMVQPDEVDQVLRDQPSGPLNMERLGEKLGADYLVAVDMRDLELKDGATLYRGRCNCSVAVYEVGKGDSPVYRKDLPKFIFPETGLPVTDMDESKFMTQYLTLLSDRVARTFYPYDPTKDVAIDAAAHSLY